MLGKGHSKSLFKNQRKSRRELNMNDRLYCRRCGQPVSFEGLCAMCEKLVEK